MMRVKSLTQTIKFCFSNQAKNIAKPTAIQFDFKLPNRNNQKKYEQSSINNNQVKITKGKRNDVLKVLKKKKENQQYKAKIQQNYKTIYQKKIQQNLKTANYHQQQYFKGQTLIQNIPLDPFYSYKLADFQRKIQLEKDKFKQFIGPIVDYSLKYQMKNKIAQLYHQKQSKYQVQQFLRYIDQYPGSPKGPNPQDDFQYFLQYASKKIPPILAHQISLNKLATQVKHRKINNITDVQYYKIPAQQNLASHFGKNRQLQPPAQKDYKPIEQWDAISQIPVMKQFQQVPQFPQMSLNNYQQYMNDMTNWQHFKNYYIKKHGQDNMIKQLQYLNKVQQQNDPQPQNPYYNFKPSAPSLLRYYKTLPKQLQQHPGVKTVYLGLEFHCNTFSAQQKQQLLNKAATMAQPLDKVSQRIMEDFIEKKKQYMTPFMVDKIFTINPQFTWDIHEFFAEIKRQQLKGQSMIKQNQGSYPEPPKIHLDWQEGVANLPVDFYDNDDGFWDQIISEKLKRQDQAKPIMKVRQHFQH